jgi:hypothetical protein
LSDAFASMMDDEDKSGRAGLKLSDHFEKVLEECDTDARTSTTSLDGSKASGSASGSSFSLAAMFESEMDEDNDISYDSELPGPSCSCLDKLKCDCASYFKV